MGPGNVPQSLGPFRVADFVNRWSGLVIGIRADRGYDPP